MTGMAPVPSPEVTHALREWRGSRRARDAARAAHEVTRALLKTLGRLMDEANERAADADSDAAQILIASGPVSQGMWTYSGADLGGGLFTVVREPATDFAPDQEDDGRPTPGHACTAIDNETA